LPPDPEELLRQAETLAGNPTATQVDLRRAISAAYYAVFHFCSTAAADLILGASARSSPSYTLVYRSIDHSRFRAVSKQLSGSPITPVGGFGKIEDFAPLAASLNEQRSSADYDPSKSYTVAEVKVVISQAREAITWFRSCTQEQQEAFLMLFLFRSRSP
jgi:uncharacterized protein (UPF0332 family)